MHKYPVRQAAFDALSRWGMDVTPGVLSEEIPKYDTVEKVWWKGPVTDEDVTKLVTLYKKLTALYIGVSDRPLTVTDEQFARLGGIKTLTTLAIWGRVTDAQLAQVAGLRNLQQFSLRSSDVTDEGLRQPAALPTLKSVTIGFNRMTDDDLRQLSALPNLKSLTIANTRITDTGLQQLTALPHLESLDISDNRITRTRACKNWLLCQI